MSGARREEGSYRRNVAVGLIVSAAAHAAVLGLARWEAPAPAGRGTDLLRAEAPDRLLRERPLEVIRIRAVNAPPGVAPAVRPSFSSPPARIAVPATLAAAVPVPRLLLAKVEVKEEARQPAAGWESVEDLLIRRGPNPKALRPIDDRPIEVLAAIARKEAERGGGGIRIGRGGGGTCE